MPANEHRAILEIYHQCPMGSSGFHMKMMWLHCRKVSNEGLPTSAQTSLAFAILVCSRVPYYTICNLLAISSQQIQLEPNSLQHREYPPHTCRNSMGVVRWTHGTGLTTLFTTGVHDFPPSTPTSAILAVGRSFRIGRFTPVLPLRTILRSTGRLTDILDQYDHRLRHESTKIVVPYHSNMGHYCQHAWP